MSATVVLLHGFAGAGRGWDPVVERLDAERYTALAPDLRGHGAARDRRPVSIEACVADVLAAAPERFDLVGYSLGGRIALHAALAAPDRVQRLVLVATTGGIEEPHERGMRRQADERLATEIERDGIGAFADRWLAGPLFAADPPAAHERARADIARNRADALAEALRGLGTGVMAPVWDRLGELTMPATVLAGARDAKFLAVGERLAAGLPDARLGVVAGAGHALPRAAPAAVADAVGGAAASLLYRIRAPRDGEAGDLKGIHRRASLVGDEHRAALLRHPEVFGVGAAELAAGGVRVAADADDLPLGFAVVVAGADGGIELDGLFVEPRAMGRGVGRALAEDAIARARAAGAQAMTVVARPASGFYEALGFADAGPADTRFGAARRLVLGL